MELAGVVIFVGLKHRDAQMHPVISQLMEVTYIQCSWIHPAGFPAQVTRLCIQPCISPALSIVSKLLRVGVGDSLLPGPFGECLQCHAGPPTGSQFPVG